MTTPPSREGRIRVLRTVRFRVLGDPVASGEVWFVLHGYRQTAERFIRRFQHLPGAGETRAVVAPEASPGSTSSPSRSCMGRSPGWAPAG